MAKVWFRSKGKTHNMYYLNSLKIIEYVPMIGDIIETNNNDFQHSTFRVKPFTKDERIALEFIVVERRYNTNYDQWELLCEPTQKSLLFLLKNIKSE